LNDSINFRAAMESFLEYDTNNLAIELLQTSLFGRYAMMK